MIQHIVLDQLTGRDKGRHLQVHTGGFYGMMEEHMVVLQVLLYLMKMDYQQGNYLEVQVIVIQVIQKTTMENSLFLLVMLVNGQIQLIVVLYKSSGLMMVLIKLTTIMMESLNPMIGTIMTNMSALILMMTVVMIVIQEVLIFLMMDQTLMEMVYVTREIQTTIMMVFQTRLIHILQIIFYVQIQMKTIAMIVPQVIIVLKMMDVFL